MILSDGKEYPMALAIRGLEAIAGQEMDKLDPVLETWSLKSGGARGKAMGQVVYLLLGEKLQIAANIACLVLLAHADPEDKRLREEVMTLFYLAAHRKMAELLEEAGGKVMAEEIMEAIERMGPQWEE